MGGQQQTTFAFTDGVSGYIKKLGLGYTAVTGSSSCQTLRNRTTGEERRAIFQFDTSSLPDGCVIDAVEFNIVNSLSQPLVNPDPLEWYIGNWIGATLDGSAADFGGGTLMRSISYTDYSPGGWIDLAYDGNDPTPYIARSGTTDIAVREPNLPASSDGWNFNTAGGGGKCQLRVTWHMPSMLPLLGVG